MISIPLEANPNYSFQIVLDGVEYSLKVTWNGREESWHLDVRDKNFNNLAINIRILPWIPLLRPHPQTILPSGDLVLVDNSSQFPKVTKPLDRDNITTQYTLVYVTKAELDVILSS